MKRITIFCLIMAITMLIGCTNTSDSTGSTPDKTTTTENATQKTDDSSLVTLTVAVSGHPKIEDFNTNLMTLMLEEQCNVDLVIDEYPSTDYITKLNLMVMSGGSELPDVLVGKPGDEMVFSWAKANAIIPLTQYYEDPSISVNLHEAVERTGVNFFSHIVSPDNEIYGIPTYNQSFSTAHLNKFYYFKPWLEALDENEPTTTGELYELLKKVASTDLNGNGKADEIGITGILNKSMTGQNLTRGTTGDCIEALMNSFVYAGDPDYFVVDQEGTVSVAYNTEGWKEGLKYLRKLIEEGLMPIETLTQDGDQFEAMKKSKDVTIFMFAQTQMGSFYDQNTVYTGIAPMEGPEGVQYASYTGAIAGIAYTITSNCENPEAAFRVGDLMCSEHFSIITRWGTEGVDWDYHKNVSNPEDYVSVYPGWDVYICAYDASGFWNSADVQNGSWMQTGPYIRQYAIANGSGKSPETLTPLVEENALCNILYMSHQWDPENYIPKLIFNTEESAIVSEKIPTLTSYVEESLANFVAGNVDIDTTWDAYLSELESIGLEAVLEVVQTVYDRMYK